MSTIAIHPATFDRAASGLNASGGRLSDRAEPAVRLTNRGRTVLFVAAVLAIAFLAISLGSSTAATNHVGAPAATHSIMVEPGQTLWQIAIAANPDGDVRQTVHEIMKLNSLPSAGGLQMGRKLAIPEYQ